MKFFLSIFLIQCILALIYCDRESFSLSDTSDLLNDVENDRDPLISLDQNAYGDMLFSSKPSSLKSKTVNYKGYSMDMSVDTFKSLRFCHLNEVCKNKYRSHFECVCPRFTLCVGQGKLYDGRCHPNLMSYVWLQRLDTEYIDSIEKPNK